MLSKPWVKTTAFKRFVSISQGDQSILEVNVNHAMLKALNSKIVEQKADDIEDLTWVLEK